MIKKTNKNFNILFDRNIYTNYSLSACFPLLIFLVFEAAATFPPAFLNVAAHVGHNRKHFLTRSKDTKHVSNVSNKQDN